MALTLLFAASSGTLAIADGKNDDNKNNQQSSNHDDDKDRNDDHVSVCHHDGKKHGHTIVIDHYGVPGHLSHGDELGSCPVSGSK
jgi:hypothetical protein